MHASYHVVKLLLDNMSSWNVSSFDRVSPTICKEHLDMFNNMLALDVKYVVSVFYMHRIRAERSNVGPGVSVVKLRVVFAIF